MRWIIQRPILKNNIRIRHIPVSLLTPHKIKPRKRTPVPTARIARPVVIHIRKKIGHLTRLVHRTPQRHIIRLYTTPSPPRKLVSPRRNIPPARQRGIRSQIRILKNRSPLGKTIYIRRMNPRIVITPHVISTPGIQHNQNNIHCTLLMLKPLQLSPADPPQNHPRH